MASILLIIATIVVAGLAAVLAYLLSFSAASSQPTILLVGPCNGGKTALFTLLQFGKKSPTHTSQHPNTSTSLTLTLADRTARLVDLPGHPKLAHLFEAELALNTPKGLVFVIDSAALARPDAIRAVAEQLYALLVRLQKVKTAVPVLIACNKSDLFTALPAPRVKTLLEAEIEKIRKARSAEISLAEGEDDEDKELLGWEGEDFKFAMLEGMEVDVVSGSVDKNDVQAWKDWMAERV
ncbi:P-loop containing nucleoside triphosphate hydrolase protein [Saitoella complicata NRRL Y-17804]|uniref:P-loop containing nucleoside triphosphate hydrolase protein n=1 Tax=Saitoella complicata (strain BCRC 22490 / CBS 7301 / JCM 7358 / NBRC 10748 / NRRL Y-17804) TaxID=698492 RepID=UPI00086739A6|nr:P-loop containing nucleoside triphosphate hydrolase protein [Saitoella complicata NRRL Y-17804]ODQ54516.1 P-loop containing nucleoside triphosphate hydrolase protein [Saitoella complicata NRRL Y-17804]